MDHDGEPPAADAEGGAGRAADTFQALAGAAEAMARTARLSARVHDEMAGHFPEAVEHAERDRRLAAAERLAAEAYRRGEVPPEDVRQVIRDVRVPDDNT